jgi:hypothetical protein
MDIVKGKCRQEEGHDVCRARRVTVVHVVVSFCLLVDVSVALATTRVGSDGALTLRPSTSSLSSCREVISAHYPRQYVAYKASNGSVPILDGRLDEPFWQDVPFTDDFVDISTTTTPKFLTHAKIRWDDEWIYVGGYIQDNAVWANITYTCHCYNQSEDQVIFHDNDFEMFFDVDGTCHNYKEYEMNAANQNWDLLLNAPYENGGFENSSRVFGKQGFDMVPPLRCATFVDGTLNDPASSPSYWTVEIAFPIEKLLLGTTLEGKGSPKNKQFWRINFSRVEWAVTIRDNKYVKDPSCQSCPNPGAPTCDNWVWSPMYVIDVHHPEMWGFLQFSTDAPNTTEPIQNIEWTPRYVAHELYYAQVNFQNVYGHFASTVEDLLPFAHYNITLSGDCTLSISIWAKRATSSSSSTSSYVALIASKEAPMAVSITQDRYILAHYFNESFGIDDLVEQLVR